MCPSMSCCPASGGHENLVTFEVLDLLDVGTRDERLKIELLRRCDGDHGNAVFDAVEHRDFRTQEDIGLAASKKLHPVDLRTALPDFDVEAGLRIKTRRGRLKNPALIRLSKEVGHDTELGRGSGKTRTANARADHSRTRDQFQNLPPICIDAAG